mgnify:CR=1 FL=1
MSERNLLERLLAFDSYDKSEVAGWRLDAEDILRNHGLYDENETDFSGLKFHGRVESFSHFDNIKAALQQLYKKKYGQIIPPVENLTQSVFIAMRFSKDMKPIYTNVYKPICDKFGLEAVRIDDQHFTGSIIDHIRTYISRAVFMIADLTHNCPGVYYEAGIADGLGICQHPIKIIWTCREKEFKTERVHFDVHMDNILIYKNKSDLERRLSERLEALLKEGVTGERC